MNLEFLNLFRSLLFVCLVLPSLVIHQTNSTKAVKLASHKNINLLPTECGYSHIPDKISEGDEAELKEFPWMTLVGFKKKSGNLQWSCGGTLINRRYVLTAAHCLSQKNRLKVFVRLGEHNLENKEDCAFAYEKVSFCLPPPLDVQAEEIKVHEEWNNVTFKNDIALIRLSTNAPGKHLESSNIESNVSPICLPLNTTTESKLYGVAGWGKTEWNSASGSNVLRKGILFGATNEECNICKIKERYCPLSDTQICAQGRKSVDVCKGDSGGPLMTMGGRVLQVGIISFKPSGLCGDDNIPSIFTRVESYMKWILDNIRK